MSDILRSAAVALLAIVYLFAIHAFAFAQEVGAASSRAAHSSLDLLGWAALIFVVAVALAIIGLRAYHRVKRRSLRGGPYFIRTWNRSRAGQAGKFDDLVKPFVESGETTRLPITISTKKAGWWNTSTRPGTSRFCSREHRRDHGSASAERNGP